MKKLTDLSADFCNANILRRSQNIWIITPSFFFFPELDCGWKAWWLVVVRAWQTKTVYAMIHAVTEIWGFVIENSKTVYQHRT